MSLKIVKIVSIFVPSRSRPWETRDSNLTLRSPKVGDACRTLSVPQRKGKNGENEGKTIVK